MSRRTCEHLQDDGLRCPNPAMYRRQVCYHHWRLLRPSAPVCDPAYVPPTFDCEASISLMTAHILRCVLAGKIDLKRAQVAMSCVRETAKSLRLQGKAGDAIETSFTHFMADYYSTLDEIQAKSAAAYPDPQPLIYPAHFADIPEDDDPEELSSRAPVTGGEGSALSAGEQSAPAPCELDNVGTGFQSRATRAPLAVLPDNKPSDAPRPRAACTTANAKTPAPAGAPDNKLSATQSKLLKKILRRGPKHPQFHLAARLLDHQIARSS